MPENDNMRNELDRLKRENAELQKRLSKYETPFSPPIHAAEPQVFNPAPSLTQSNTHPSLDFHSGAQDKIQLFRSLFHGREDVYPVLWQSDKTGRKGYAPACENPWAGKGAPKKYLPLTDLVVQSHLSGKITIGVYPLQKDSTCHFLACDFDKAGWELDAVSYWRCCQRHGIPCALERSRSGNGAHAWVFFSSPVPAVNARQLGFRILRDDMEERAEVDLASYDRLFPNQDFMPRGGFGNLIALPLQKSRRAQGNTEFFDPTVTELQPYPDQWVFLSAVARLTPQALDGLLARIPPIEVGVQSVRKPTAALMKKHPAPKKIRCDLNAQVSIEKSGIPPWLISQIKHLASLHNPLFYERQNMRFSTYGIPRFIRCYGEDATHLHLPRGLFEPLRDILSGVGVTLDVNDSRPQMPKMDFQFHGILTSAQQKVVKILLAHDMGVLAAPPGVGKTVMGCYTVAQRNVPTLILAHRKPILEQWRSQLKTLLGLTNKGIGQVGGGRNRISGVVDLAMIQSLKGIDDLGEFFSHYEFIVVDEVHHLPAVSFDESIKLAPVRRILGLTATPYRRDGLQDLIFMQCGPLRHQMESSNGGVKLTLNIRQTDFSYENPEGNLAIQDVFKSLVEDTARNTLMADDVLNALKEGRRCIVLSQRKEHCRTLADLLIERGKVPDLLSGDVGKKERTAILERIKDSPNDAELLIIATGQYLGEGFDCPRMDTLFLTFPVSFKGKLIQYVGRIQRDFEGKTEAVIYDYFDERVPVLKKMSSRRLKTYKAVGVPL